MTGRDARLSASFRLTDLFLRKNPRYRETLDLTPENHQFDPILWHSSTAALRQMLESLAEDEGVTVTSEDLDRAVANLVEGVVRRSAEWGRRDE